MVAPNAFVIAPFSTKLKSRSRPRGCGVRACDSTSPTSGRFFSLPSRGSRPVPRYRTAIADAESHDFLSTLVACKPNACGPSFIHLVSAARHAGEDSAQAVATAIETASPPPDTLVLELCGRRAGLLKTEEERLIDRERAPIVADKASSSWSLRLLDAGLGALVAMDGSDHAADLRAAVASAKALGIPQDRVILGDRDINSTMTAWTESAGWGERVILLIDTLLGLLRRQKAKVSQDDLVVARNIARRRAPAMYRVLYVERELQLAWSVRDSPAALQASSILLVCGRSHIAAIKSHLERGQEVDIANLKALSLEIANKHD
jgi:pheromone shutdown protein TraB